MICIICQLDYQTKERERVKRVFQKAADVNHCLFGRFLLPNSTSLHVSFTLIKHTLIDAPCKCVTRSSMYFPYQTKTHNIQHPLKVPATKTHIRFFSNAHFAYPVNPLSRDHNLYLLSESLWERAIYSLPDSPGPEH